MTLCLPTAGRSYSDGTVVRRLLKVTYQGQHQTGATSDVYDCGRSVCMCAADFPPSKFQFSSDRKTLTISSVCMNSCEGGRDDLMVIQCNASNQHGYVLANGYVNVFGKFYINSVWQGCARDLFGRDPKRDVVSPRRDRPRRYKLPRRLVKSSKQSPQVAAYKDN